jgi:hypothetical protein
VDKSSFYAAISLKISDFCPHGMEKCAVQPFYAFVRERKVVSCFQSVRVAEGFSSAGSRSPPRAPAVGREETRSRPFLPANLPATDQKRICRLFFPVEKQI